MTRVTTQPIFEDCRIINFCVIVSDRDIAERMQADGWNVKWLAPRDEGDEETPYIPVSVSFENVPPKIVMLTSKGRTPLDESMVSILDYADIETVDIVLNPYNWEVNGKSGVKAYLKSMYVTIHEDALDRKYAEIDASDDIPF